ncbi:MAG TPA: winged helix DNA-binding domain-containing protein [Polyangiales bacterium]|nr:winged helix DNA-binding domain-containing protein [Polyangiales bacterium]
MKARELGRQRLMNLHVASSRCVTAAEAVGALGAMQAQDYQGALWAIGLRVPGSKLADVERAVEERTIVRSWPMRGTLHFVAAADLRWLLDLLAARVTKAVVRRQAQLELDAPTLRKVDKLLTRELAGKTLTRDALRDAFTRAKISPDNGRLYHCLLHFALEQRICFAVPEGKQPTFALLDEWLPKVVRLSQDEALATLAARYFISHGPATQQDLMRWAMLTAAEAKRGIAAAEGIVRLDVEGRRYWTGDAQVVPSAATRGTFLLPGFDEYILGYRDRDAILDAEHKHKIVPGANGVFRPTIVHGGQVLGTWKADASKKAVKLTPTGFATFTTAHQRAFASAAKGYAKFLGKSVAHG